MKRTIKLSDVLTLSVPERIELVEDIWDSIAENPDKVELTEAQKAVLDARLDAYHRNPSEGSPWDVVKNRILSRN
jgi:putative addiction module component (TIGR02574 family)